MTVKPISDLAMELHDVNALLQTLSCLKINDRTTTEEASAAMRMLTSFNQCAVGMVCFSGQTPWERHPDDELLYILEGEVKVTIFIENKVRELTLATSSVFVVPRGLWHKQFASKGVKLLFVTSQEENEISTEENPPTN